MSSGKGGSSTTTVELPPEIRDQAIKNMELASKVGSLPYAPNFGAQVAGFNPMQTQSFENTNNAARAFGMGATGHPLAGLPVPQQLPTGGTGYSTQPMYQMAMSKVDPKIMALYNQFFYPHNQQAQQQPAAQQPVAPQPPAPPTNPPWMPNNGDR